MKSIKKLILVGFIVLLTACGKYEAIDEEKFIAIMSQEQFKVVDVEYQFEQYGYFDEAYVAIHPNNNYQIEFYELEDERFARNFYETNKNKFESSIQGTKTTTNKDFRRTNKYTLTTDDEYKVVSRIDETVIYLNVKKEYKDEVNRVLKKLGY